jgi:hypothetical protein
MMHGEYNVKSSDGTLCKGATGRRQANNTSLESASLSIVPFRANVEQRVQHQLLVQTLTTFRVVPDAGCGLLAAITPEQDHQHNDLGTQNAYALLCVHCHLMVTFTSACHLFSNIYICHFLHCHIFGPKKVAMT